MAYRYAINLKSGQFGLGQVKELIPEIARTAIQDASDLITTYGKEHLSGVPFSSRTGGHVIQKRTGRGAASVQAEYPYGSPFRSRIYASAMTRYADNPEEWNYLAILETGRGEVRPKYTPSAKAGYASKARLTIPGGNHQLVNGENGLRGISGRYFFAKTLPPMAGKYWFESAVNRADPEIQQAIAAAVQDVLKEHGF
jgi:hypothetical protein